MEGMAPPVVGQDESPRFWAKSAAGQFARGDQNSGERASPASPGVLRPEPLHTLLEARLTERMEFLSKHVVTERLGYLSETVIFIGFVVGIGAVEFSD